MKLSDTPIFVSRRTFWRRNSSRTRTTCLFPSVRSSVQFTDLTLTIKMVRLPIDIVLYLFILSLVTGNELEVVIQDSEVIFFETPSPQPPRYDIFLSHKYKLFELRTEGVENRKKRKRLAVGNSTIYTVSKKSLVTCLCMGQNYPKYRQCGQDRGGPSNLKNGVNFSYVLGTLYTNLQQFPIK